MHQNWTTLEKRISHKYRDGWAHLDEYEAIAQWTYRRGAVVMDEQEEYSPENYRTEVVFATVKPLKEQRASYRLNPDQMRDVTQAIRDELSGSACTCEHDCCGCRSYSVQDVLYRGDQRVIAYPEYEFVVTIASSQNY